MRKTLMRIFLIVQDCSYGKALIIRIGGPKVSRLLFSMDRVATAGLAQRAGSYVYFRGCVDNQAKVRGERVEFDDIRAAPMNRRSDFACMVKIANQLHGMFESAKLKPPCSYGLLSVCICSRKNILDQPKVVLGRLIPRVSLDKTSGLRAVGIRCE